MKKKLSRLSRSVPELALPRLAIGSWPAGSGRACAMNAVSYLNGDTEITDIPKNVWFDFTIIAANINDSVCRHRAHNSKLLCSDCAHKMWVLTSRFIGTNIEWGEERDRVHGAMCAWFSGTEPHGRLQHVADFATTCPPLSTYFELAVQDDCDQFEVAHAMLDQFDLLTGRSRSPEFTREQARIVVTGSRKVDA